MMIFVGGPTVSASFFFRGGVMRAVFTGYL
jgi:hypothetical protein